MADFDELVKSEYLFARKFDDRVDSKIIDKIISHIEEIEGKYAKNKAGIEDLPGA